MSSLIRKFAIPLSAIAFVVFFMATAFILMTRVSFAGDSSTQRDGRLFTIHDRGIEKVIVSKAVTIGDVLKEAGITVETKDLVEPSVDEKLVASDYQVNIYRARPVVIVDGSTKTKVMTPYQTVSQIVESAKITLYPEDKTILKQADNIIADGAGLQLTIDRATPFTFDLFGDTKTVRTQATTVSGMLAEKGIKIDKNDRLSVDKNAKITDGMSLRLWREGKQTVTAEVPIDFETEKVQDGDREIGYHEIRTNGEKGLRTVTYEVLVQNGKEVNRTEIASLTTKEPIKQVEVVGIKLVLPPGSHTDWMAAAGISASDYGYVDYVITRESHWNPGSTNLRGCGGNGCYGLGQTSLKSLSGSCPNWQSDPVCQLRFFSGYVVSHGYGSWAAAYNFWQSHGWW